VIFKKAFRLDVSTIETLDDVKMILEHLSLTTEEGLPGWDDLKKYFTKEIQIPVDLPTNEDLKEALETAPYKED